MSVKRASTDDTSMQYGKQQRLGHRGPQTRSFRIRNTGQFDVKFPHFREPAEIGSFSLDINRTFDNSKRELKYFIKPEDFNHVHFDLRKGYSSMIQKDETQKDYIHDILRWIDQNSHKFCLNTASDAVNCKQQELQDGDICIKRKLNTDFVCWRGLLTKLLCTPYENREGWQIAVTLYNGTYYLCDFETEEKRRQNESRTERDKEMCCWGWKFEQYLTADSPDSRPNTDVPFNNCEAFCTVIRSRLNSHSLVFSGEVDAVDVSKGADKGHYVEFKTTRQITHPRQTTSFKRFKLIKWWAQSFLVGIREIVCGYRDDVGIVHKLETFNTQKIPDISKDIHNPWKPNICFNFLDQLLCFIKDSVKVDDHRMVHLMQWSPGSDVTCSKLGVDSEFKFLPSWYTDT